MLEIIHQSVDLERFKFDYLRLEIIRGQPALLCGFGLRHVFSDGEILGVENEGPEEVSRSLHAHNRVDNLV